MKKTLIILGLLIFNLQFTTSNSLMAQEEMSKHELSASFQGLGLGSMPFYGPVKWDDQPNLTLGFGINYNYWFNTHFGVRTGVRLNRLSHNQRISNLDYPYTVSTPLTSGSAPTTVNLHGSATTLQEEQQYNFIELPIQLAMRCKGMFVNLGISLAKAIHATGDYSYTDPACDITALPDLGIYPTASVPMTLNGTTEGSVKNANMAKPFYCLLDAEAGYNFPVGETSSLAVGLFGSFAPITHKTGSNVEVYNLRQDASYTVTQPSASTLVEKIGYYELGLSLGVNFGLGRNHKKPADNAQALRQSDNQTVANDSRYEEMASEMAAMKAAQKKNEEEIAALKAALKKNEKEIAALKNAPKRTEEKAEAAKPVREQPKAETRSAKPSNYNSLEELTGSIQINFDYNKTKPLYDETTEANLRALCAKMQANPTIHVAVIGHTDWMGSNRNNRVMGRKRANKVKQLMVSFGAPASNIEIDTCGKHEPIDTNETQEGRAHNRRVTLNLK